MSKLELGTGILVIHLNFKAYENRKNTSCNKCSQGWTNAIFVDLKNLATVRFYTSDVPIYSEFP